MRRIERSPLGSIDQQRIVHRASLVGDAWRCARLATWALAASPNAPGASTRRLAAVHRSIRLAGHADRRRSRDRAPTTTACAWRRSCGIGRGHAGDDPQPPWRRRRDLLPGDCESGCPTSVLSWTCSTLSTTSWITCWERAWNSIERVAAGADPGEAAGRLLRVAAVMDDHLDLEDDHVVPAFARCFSGVEYERLTKAAIKHVGLSRQAAFTVPYIGYGPTSRIGGRCSTPHHCRSPCSTGSASAPRPADRAGTGRRRHRPSALPADPSAGRRDARLQHSGDGQHSGGRDGT